MPASLKHLTDKKSKLTSLLARWKDGLYYTAAIVKCDKTNKRCLVCFEDGSEVWVTNRDVHLQLSLDQLNEDEDIVCCICDDGASEAPNEIILCDVCQQGYHQKCHNPPVDSSKIDESDDTSDHKDWFCATCSYILNQSNRAKLSATATQQQQQPQQHDSPPPPPTKKQPPSPQTSQPKQQAQSDKIVKSKQQPAPSVQAPTTKSNTERQNNETQRQQASKSTTNKQQPTGPVAVVVPASATPTSISTASVATTPTATNTTAITVPQQQVQKSITTTAIGPVKSSANHHQQVQQKAAPYYPLSNQARTIATSSTAALASMTASSALVVGSSAGRTKQDLVNQSNRSSQRQSNRSSPNVEVISPPVKHAVRKSSVNFVMPVRQSALPTATRSVLPNTIPPAKIPQQNQTSKQPNSTPVVTITPSPSTTNTTTIINNNTPITLPQSVNATSNKSSTDTSPINSSSSSNNNNNNNNNINSNNNSNNHQNKINETKRPATSTQASVINSKSRPDGVTKQEMLSTTPKSGQALNCTGASISTASINAPTTSISTTTTTTSQITSKSIITTGVTNNNNNNSASIGLSTPPSASSSANEVSNSTKSGSVVVSQQQQQQSPQTKPTVIMSAVSKQTG